MKKIAFFSIPAHGHTNPMLAVAKALLERGNRVRFYSFDEFASKIAETGVEFVSCSRYLPELTARQQAGLMKVSTTEMTIQDIRVTLAMDPFLKEEISAFKPDVIFSDSVCFWGKLTAWKYQIPLVVSTSTFAFNRYSASYMKNSPSEMADLILGLPRISRELKKLEPFGYRIKNALALVQSEDTQDSVVYTSRRFQPFSESYSDHYLFVGPSLLSRAVPGKKKERPLVYIAMGTVINDRPDLYRNCIQGLKDLDLDIILSVGKTVEIQDLGDLPENVKVCLTVDQPEVLSRADVFLTHCGMNSVSESLYMATPMVLYPQTGEQQAVARRVMEIGAGILLKEDSPEEICACVKAILENPSYREAACASREDFRACPGPEGAAAFIESAPHQAEENPKMRDVRRANNRFQAFYWSITAVLLAGWILAGWKAPWIIGILMAMLNPMIGRKAQERSFGKVFGKQRAFRKRNEG